MTQTATRRRSARAGHWADDAVLQKSIRYQHAPLRMSMVGGRGRKTDFAEWWCCVIVFLPCQLLPNCSPRVKVISYSFSPLSHGLACTTSCTEEHRLSSISHFVLYCLVCSFSPFSINCLIPTLHKSYSNGAIRGPLPASQPSSKAMVPLQQLQLARSAACSDEETCVPARYSSTGPTRCATTDH